MKATVKTVVLCLALAAIAPLQNAQTPQAAPAGRVMGQVAAIDAAAKKITLKTDAGAEVAVQLVEPARFRRVAPGATTLAGAATIAFTDVAVGDRVLALGLLAPDQKSITSNSVVVMSKADIAKKHEADRAEWQKRGVTGIVAAVNAEAKQVTINVRGGDGNKSLMITLADGAVARRYAPDSNRYDDSKPAPLTDIRVGDQVRALGNRSADGFFYTADELISGTFRTIAGTVISVDAEAKTIKLNDLDTKKQVVVKINTVSSLKRMPAQVAQMMAIRLNNTTGAPGAPGATPQGAGPRNAGGPGGPGGPGGGPGGPGGRGGTPDIQQMIDRMPPLTLAELKPGDALIVSAGTGSDVSQMTAITLVAGVEPILSATPANQRPMVLGAWSLDMNGGQ